MDTPEEADKAISEMSGFELKGRAMTVTSPLLITPVVVPPLVSSTGSETSVTTPPVPWWPLGGLVDCHGASLQLEPGHL